MTPDEQDPSNRPVEGGNPPELRVEPAEQAAVPTSPTGGACDGHADDTRVTLVDLAEVAGAPADPESHVPQTPQEEPTPPPVEAAMQGSPVAGEAPVAEPVTTAEPVAAPELVPVVESAAPEPHTAAQAVIDEPVDGKPSEAGTEDSGTPGAAPPPPRGRGRGALALGALVAAAAVVAAVLVWSPWQDELPDDAAFRAAGSVVTETDVQRRTDVLRALYGVQVPEEAGLLDRFRRDTAKAMAISLVLDDAVVDADIRIADKAVSDALDRFLEQRYPQGGRAAYVQALSAEGVGEQDVLDEIRRQLEIARLFDQVTADVEVSDEELRELFEADPAAYALPERRRLRHIVLADQAAAQAALGRLRAGEDFAAVAAQVSLDGSTKDAGGDLGVAAAADLDQRFARAAFAVTSGQLFGPVQTPFGWHVGRVDEVLPGKATTFDEVRAQLREQQETERRVAVWREFIAARVEDADVVYADRYRPQNPLPDLTDAPVGEPARSSSASPTPP
jgi:peptidyl-prolyl cis-trans isomerase C